MGNYTIQIAAKLSGIGIHTLRAWEKRYNAVTPKRSPTARRFYDDRDIEKLRLLQQLCTLGHSIGSIAKLSHHELTKLLAKMGATPESASTQLNFVERDASKTSTGIVNLQESLTGLLIGLEHYKLDVISHEIEKLKLVLSPRAFVFEVLLPIMSEVGLRVQRSQADVAQEHSISAILRFHVGQMLYQHLNIKRKKMHIVALATPEGDYHEFGILAVALLCCHYDIKFYYFGPNMPASSLLEAAKSVEATSIIIGTADVSLVFPTGYLDTYLTNVMEGIGKAQTLYVGGDGVFHQAKFRRIRKFNFVPNLKMMDEILREFN